MIDEKDVANIQMALINKMDSGFKDLRDNVDNHFEGVRTEFRDELHRCHARIDTQQSVCATSRQGFAQDIGEKANESCVIPMKKDIATNKTHLRWIIYILTSTGGILTAGALIVNFLFG